MSNNESTTSTTETAQAEAKRLARNEKARAKRAEKKAAKAEAKPRQDKRSPAATLKHYREKGNYALSGGYAGQSLNNGDTVALALRMLEPNRVVAVAEAVLPGIKKGELKKKYAKLNPGMQRMNAGNRIRAIHRSAIMGRATRRSCRL